MKQSISIAILVACLSGCMSVAPVNEYVARNAFESGEQHLQNGNYPQAAEDFEKAYDNVVLGKLGKKAEGEALGKLGRIYGKLCRYSDAHKAFKDAVAAYAAHYGETSDRTVPYRIELARFSYDIGEYEKAVGYFKETMDIGRKKLIKTDPSLYSSLMKDYSDALTKTGSKAEGRAAMQESLAYKGKKGTKNIGEVPYERYPSACTPEPAS